MQCCYRQYSLYKLRLPFSVWIIEEVKVDSAVRDDGQQISRLHSNIVRHDLKVSTIKYKGHSTNSTLKIDSSSKFNQYCIYKKFVVDLIL